MSAQSPNGAQSANLRRGLRASWLVGLVTIATCFGGFGVWASMATLSSASIAPGQVSPDGAQRTVQHLEGGIVRRIHMREGDVVSKGDALIVLDSALASANQKSRARQLQRLLVVRDRLIAQERGAAEFEPEIVAGFAPDATFKSFIANEKRALALQARVLREQDDIYGKQITQVDAEIESLQAQIQGMRDQLEFIEKELADKRKLLKRGLVRAPEVFALARKRAELTSGNAALAANIARARQKIEEIRAAAVTMRTEDLSEVATRLSEVNSEIAQAEEAFAATSDVLSRTQIASPITGRVLSLNFKTLGGVVGPGEPIMTIVPIEEDLIIDARLSPTDIDNVSRGMKAKVQLSSYQARHMVPLEGEVVNVGADAQIDEDTRERYYALRVRVDEDDLSSRSDEVELQPGMPAEVFVQTGSHTPLEYAFAPFLRSFARAFREEPM